MPADNKVCTLYVLFFASLTICVLISEAYPNEGIDRYYIKYDIKSSKNIVANDNLLMIPAKNDFRTEKFSRITVSGVISATPGELVESRHKRIKENALKHILLNNGLKSIKTKDYDTVISYEGVIIAPLTLAKDTYVEDQSGYTYEVSVEFSPIAFPDRWETLNMRYKLKEFFYDFFQLFK